MLNRARRARMIPMESIRDDRAESMGGAGGYQDKDDFWSGWSERERNELVAEMARIHRG